MAALRPGPVRVGQFAVVGATLAMLVVILSGELLWSADIPFFGDSTAEEVRNGTFDPTQLGRTLSSDDAPVMTWLATQVVRTPVIWGGLLAWGLLRQGGPQTVLARLAAVSASLGLIVLALRAAVPDGNSALAVWLHEQLGGVPGSPFTLTTAGWAHVAALVAMVVGGALAAGVGWSRPPFGRSGRRTGSVHADG